MASIQMSSKAGSPPSVVTNESITASRERFPATIAAVPATMRPKPYPRTD